PGQSSPECRRKRDRAFAPSEYADGGSLYIRLEHGVKTVACGHVDRNLQLVLQILLDTDKIERIESRCGVVVDKKIQIALWLRLVSCGRAKNVKRDRAERPDGGGSVLQPSDGFNPGHPGILPDKIEFLNPAVFRS